MPRPIPAPTTTTGGHRDDDPLVVTAVIGAGPAGLLFAAAARLLFTRQGGDPAAWRILLFDKRRAYERTHRLRIDPVPYRALAAEVDDPRFDEVLAFLDDQGFSPAANQLEEHLAALVSALGIPRDVLHLGAGEGQVPLGGLRHHLELSDLLPATAHLTVVGADSVHSAVRDAVGGAPVEHTHQTVARLRVVGDGLPERLGRIEQYRLSKVLGSVVDYRRNPNGFAEVDVFLGPEDQARLSDLGATPAQPVELGAELVATLDAPLLARLVDHLRSGMTGSSCEVLLQSTFLLEHRFTEQVVHTLEGGRTEVFLVGDAAVSLPFFRGMACLGACVRQLALAHCDLVHLASGAAETPELDAEVHALLEADDRPVRVGPKLLPGRVVRVERTVWHGDPAVVVLHTWAMRWGVHVLRRDPALGWESEHHLAPVRAATARRDFAAHATPGARYQHSVERIRRSEIATVRARATLVRGARELARVSALLPFPLQTWFLSIPDRSNRPGRPSAGVGVNALLATVAALAALAGPVLSARLASGLGALWWLSLVVEAVGGVAYRATQELEPASDVWLRRVWRAQIAAVAVAGAASCVILSLQAGSLTAARAAVSWLVLGGAFVAGILVHDGLGRRLFARARFGDEAA